MQTASVAQRAQEQPAQHRLTDGALLYIDTGE